MQRLYEKNLHNQSSYIYKINWECKGIYLLVILILSTRYATIRHRKPLSNRDKSPRDDMSSMLPSKNGNGRSERSAKPTRSSSLGTSSQNCSMLVGASACACCLLFCDAGEGEGDAVVKEEMQGGDEREGLAFAVVADGPVANVVADIKASTIVGLLSSVG
jgi:hypothetical protein